MKEIISFAGDIIGLQFRQEGFKVLEMNSLFEECCCVVKTLET
jgi:hypothetical protein